MTVFYFTATGNSLYAAKKFSNTLVSIPQAIHAKEPVYRDAEIGIVAPVYAGELPGIVREFIKRSRFQADYVFIILTYGMNDSVAGEWSAVFAGENGLHVDFIRTVRMADNYLPAFDMDRERVIDKDVEGQLDRALQSVRNREKGIPKSGFIGRTMYKAVKKQPPEIMNGSQLKVTGKCVGCGVCAHVCPVGNIGLANGHAVRRESTCLFCLACAHACPQKAIVCAVSDKNPNARCRNGHVTLEEIIAANRQE